MLLSSHTGNERSLRLWQQNQIDEDGLRLLKKEVVETQFLILSPYTRPHFRDPTGGPSDIHCLIRPSNSTPSDVVIFVWNDRSR